MDSLSGKTSSISLIRQLWITAICLISHVGRIVAPAIAAGRLAFISQPFPVTGFLLAFFVELGSSILRVPGLLSRITTLALTMILIAAGLSFHCSCRPSMNRSTVKLFSSIDLRKRLANHFRIARADQSRHFLTIL
jgi:uncharacterized membrane protein YphA (DoxX/SURF4 family)